MSLPSTSYLRGLAISLSICVCCRFLHGLDPGLGARSGTRDWIKVRALNTCIYVKMEKDEVFGYNCLSRN